MTTSSASPASAAPTAGRLAFIDGLRGLAALLVMLCHARTLDETAPMPAATLALASPRDWLLWPTCFATQMVWLFLMVSGFSLAHSELARRAHGQATPLAEFARRRAWRILPVYYAAMAISVLAMQAVAWLAPWRHYRLAPFRELTWQGLLSHLLLLHDYCEPWLYQFEPPLWSLAAEAQLYVGFPLLFAAMARWRTLPVMAAAMGLLFLPRVLGWLPPVLAASLLASLGVFFVAGMGLAFLARARPHRSGPLLAVAGGFLALAAFHNPYAGPVPAYDEALWLCGFGALHLGLYHARPAWWNLASWSVLRRLGDCSYPLYVVHYPIAVLTVLGISALGLPPWPGVCLSLALVSGVSIAAAWGLHLTLERWSLARMRAVGRERPVPLEVPC